MGWWMGSTRFGCNQRVAGGDMGRLERRQPRMGGCQRVYVGASFLL